MVVNSSTTELVLFQKDLYDADIILEDGMRIKISDSLKALGVWINNKLKWNFHIHELRKKVTQIISGLKLIRCKLTFKQALNVVTAQLFSIIYYASPAWLTPAICRTERDDIERLHFKA